MIENPVNGKWRFKGRHGCKGMTVITILKPAMTLLLTVVFAGVFPVVVSALPQLRVNHGPALSIDELPDHVQTQEHALGLYADYSDVRGDRVVLYLVNLTDRSYGFLSEAGDLLVKLEWQAPAGDWERAEPYEAARGGRCIHGSVLPPLTLRPGHFCRFLGYYPSAGQHGTVRYRMYLDMVFAAGEQGRSPASRKVELDLVSNVGVGMVSLEAVERARYDELAVRASRNFDVLAAMVRGEGGLENRGQAVASLGRVPEQRTLELLQELLHDEDGEFRRTAIMPLSRIASRFDAARHLVEDAFLTAEDTRTRKIAVLAMANMPPSSRTIELLNKALQDEVPEIRYAAIGTLAKIGGESPQAVEVIRKLLSSPDYGIRMVAIRAWARIPMSEQTIPLLENMLRDEVAEVRYMAIYKLADLVPQAEEARTILEELLEAPDSEMSRRAAHALRLVERRKTNREKLLEDDSSASETP